MARTKCPPGILCITPSLIMFVVGILLLVIAIYIFTHKEIHIVEKRQEIVYEKQNPEPKSIQINVNKGDDRYTRAPKPLQNWLNPVDLDNVASAGSIGSIPVIATRGLPEAYQSMGIITTSSGELLPLYGRRTASRGDRFNYYTRTDTNNPIPLPINHKRRDCQDDVGCDELFDGENVKIVPTGQNGSVTIYRFNGPTYIPGLI